VGSRAECQPHEANDGCDGVIVTQPDQGNAERRICALFVRMICERIAPGSERRKSQPKFFKPYRGVYRLTRREKKSLNGSDIYVAEGVSAYRH
jgi:hypothetical protein